MNIKEILISEIENTPESVLSEVLDFVYFLKEKNIGEKMDTAVVSEASLGKDWLRIEEEEAWKDL